MKSGKILLMTLLTIGLSASAQAQQSPHKHLTFSCESCHVPTSFREIHFNHSKTGFLLEKRHAGVNCTSCHDIKDFSQVEKTCFSCHDDIHEAKLGGNCEKCHTTAGWNVLDAEQIHAQTNFPLMGRHVLVDCQSCHRGFPNGDLALKTTRCESCHQQQYLDANAPNHVDFGFSTDCRQCHQMNGWQPANMPGHDQLFFPIFSGEHRGKWTDCATCHTDANNRKVFSCVTCHAHRQSKMDEEHRGIPGYTFDSQACLSCHPNGSKSEFREHDTQYFPIFSGKHNHKWDNCATCHTDANNRKVFSCVTCHEHRQSKMDEEHKGIPGYVFNSANCYQCHPTGEKGDFEDHDAQFFPIFSGTHNNKWDQCATCHTDVNNRKVFSCVTCHEHEQSVMDPKHQSITGYVFNSANCYQCHPTGEKSDFTDHDTQYFPIYSGKHNNKWDQCATCHTDVNNRKVFSCVTCHEHEQSVMDPK
ncbi:MAG: hypothetical protein D6814_15355, partial [Calditrichaeota bacterium]